MLSSCFQKKRNASTRKQCFTTSGNAPVKCLTLDLRKTYTLAKKTKKRSGSVLEDGRTKKGKSEQSLFDDENGDYIVKEMEVWNEVYLIEKLIGRGSFGQVVKAVHIETEEQVAIKIIKNKQSFTEQAQIEIQLLDALNIHQDPHLDLIVEMKEAFMHKNHVCIVYELCSFNLYEVIRKGGYVGLPLGLVRKFALQLLHALRILSDVGIIHCDLKPENILLRDPRKPFIKLIDFGSSCFVNQRAYTYIQSRFYRSPEVILGHQYGTAIDMWSCGCVLMELLTGEPLFPGSSEAEQICRICDLLGLPSVPFIEKTSKDRLNKYFCKVRPNEYRLIPSKSFRPTYPTLSAIIERIRYRKQASTTDLHRFQDLVSKMLILDPEKRISPAEALNHPFFVQMVDQSSNTDLVDEQLSSAYKF
ncbi:kinase-like domain-containing protein [Gorgonomyces haynaldii]|nr:kinase-like domain-containing protein [Gorgonomyces haynaldii]